MPDLRDAPGITRGRPLGHFNPPPAAPADTGATSDKPALVVTDERCSDCAWPEVCGRDRTCWDENKRVRQEQARRRALDRDLTNVVSLDERRAEREAKRLFALLTDGVAEGVQIVVPREPHAAARRLLERIGATWVVDKTAEPTQPAGRGVATQWTRETIVEAIQAWARKHGHPPTHADWAKASDEHPNYALVRARFGTFSAGIEAAGFPRPDRSTRYAAAKARRKAVGAASTTPTSAESTPPLSTEGEPCDASAP